MRLVLIRDVRHENGLVEPPDAAPPVYEVRRDVRPGDADAIVELHDRLYHAEHGMDHRFAEGVAQSVGTALERGWPQGGAAWIVEWDGRFAGSVALTDEGDGLGQIRWVLLDPALRGTGLGRRLLSEAVAKARANGMKRLRLETFSALRAAARIYRDLGFRVVSEERIDKWGPEITYQHYELEL